MGRYKRIAVFAKDIYQENSPVLIKRGVLFWDGLLRKYCVRLEFENLTDEVISDMVVKLALKDADGGVLEREHAYKGFACNHTRNFGWGNAIPFMEKVSAVEGVSVEKVSFFEAKPWASEGAWGSVPLEKIEAAYQKISWFDKMFVAPLSKPYHKRTYGDVWRCSCGKIHKNYRTMCVNCLQSKGGSTSIHSKEIFLQKHGLYELTSFCDWNFQNVEEYESEQTKQRRMKEEKTARRKKVGGFAWTVTIMAALSLFFCSFFGYAHAHYGYIESEGFIYNAVYIPTVTGRTTTDAVITVPARIGNRAFQNDDYLTSITISGDYVGKNAFYGCDNLTKIVFTETEGWYKTWSWLGAFFRMGGEPIEVTDTTQNAVNLKGWDGIFYLYKI